MNLRVVGSAILLTGLLTSISACAKDVGDICAAKMRSPHSIGASVSFKGKILSDGMHSTLVIPDRCPGEGYAMSAGDADDDPASIVRHAVMQIGAPGTTDKEIVVDVDAIVVSLPNGHVGIRVTRLNRMVLTYPLSLSFEGEG
jgi:hypothetical protein